MNTATTATPPATPATKPIASSYDRYYALPTYTQRACMNLTIYDVTVALQKEPHARLTRFEEIFAGHILNFEMQRDTLQKAGV
jgi:hypothetical protein